MTDPAGRGGGLFSRTVTVGAAAGLAGGLLGAGAVTLLSPQGAGSAAGVEVREYILANPEILRDAAQRLQQKEMAQAVDTHRAALETPYGNAWAGAADADVVLVEFFDYACPYCHQSVADIDRLLAEDKKLKVVWREWPVLGEDSVVAAEASLAAASQGKFAPFYRALFANGRPTPAALAAARTAAGIAPAAPANARGEIEKNYELARAIGATGTPVFVVGDQVLQGAVGYDRLKAAIEEARKQG